MPRVVLVTGEVTSGLGAAFPDCEVVIVPPRASSFRGAALPVPEETWCAPLLSPGILFLAFWTMLAHPRASWAALARNAKDGSTCGRLAAHLLAAPKGLWLANLAESWEADRFVADPGEAHVVARVAGSVLGVPVSVRE
jgi:hypothetical protein